jgi:tripartite-type tricarboxylate transporter receptor subunit TctC
MPKEASAWYVKLFRKLSESKEFREYLKKNGLKSARLTGSALTKWLGETENLHRGLMAKGGLLQK